MTERDWKEGIERKMRGRARDTKRVIKKICESNKKAYIVL